MKLIEVVDAGVMPPKLYSFMLGKVVGEVIIQVKEQYNSLASMWIHPGSVVLSMYAGGTVKVASLMKAAAKAHSIPVLWEFRRENSRDEHDYVFKFNQDDFKLDSHRVVDGMKTTKAFQVYTNLEQRMSVQT